MSWIRSLGSGGGGSQPSQTFLYKNGVDNITLTGGLTLTGYSFATGYSPNGTVTFNDSNISMVTTTSSAYYTLVGTTIKVDFTNISSVIVKYHLSDNVSRTVTAECTGIRGSYYLSIINYQNHGSYCNLGISVASEKGNAWVSPNRVAAGSSNDQSNTVYVDSIELLPVNYPTTIFGDYLKEAFVSSNRISSWTGSSYTYSYPNITYAEDSITISRSAPVPGYVATIMSNLQVDLTDIKTVNVTVLASQAPAGQTRFALCDEISNGYTEDVVQILQGYASNLPVTLSLDASNIIGNKYLNICCYCGQEAFSIKLTDIELVPISPYDDIKVVTNGVLNSQFTWSKSGNSLNITEFASSNYTYFLDNAGSTFGYVDNINTNNLKYLKIDARFVSGNGTPYASKSYPQDSQKSSLSTTRTTYTFDIEGYNMVSPSIGTTSGSYAVEVYNIWLTNNN